MLKGDDPFGFLVPSDLVFAVALRVEISITSHFKTLRFEYTTVFLLLVGLFLLMECPFSELRTFSHLQPRNQISRIQASFIKGTFGLLGLGCYEDFTSL